MFQQIKEYENAVFKMRSRGGRVVYPLQAPEPDGIRYDGETLISTTCKSCESHFARFSI